MGENDPFFVVVVFLSLSRCFVCPGSVLMSREGKKKSDLGIFVVFISFRGGGKGGGWEGVERGGERGGGGVSLCDVP